ncbi:MAG: IclR family transcriptional regulator [Hyphomicrobiales bacterium]
MPRAVSYRNVVQKPEPGAVQVIARAIAVLKACNRLGPGLSLGEIAREVDLPRSTVQRIVQALSEGGFLVSGSRWRSVTLGPDLLVMGAEAAGRVVELAYPSLKALAGQTGETVDLARLNRDHMVFVNQVAGAHRLQAVSAVGDTFPLHCTANGKAALALLDDESLRRALAERLLRFTANTLTDHRQLLRQVKEVRAGAVAADLEEHTLGICALGLGFMDHTRQIYAVSIPIPAVRFAAMRKRCAPLLHEAVAQIRQRLNHEADLRRFGAE